MVKVESRIGTINQIDEKIYNYLSDFNNFTALIPQDKVKDWEATTDTCKFAVDGIGQVGMKLVEKEPFKTIKIASEAQIMGFTFWIQLKNMSENDTKIKLTIHAEVNVMMAPMVKGPLKKFVDSLVDQAEKMEL